MPEGIPIPGSDLRIDLNPFDNGEPDTKAEKRRKLAKRWDGKGTPPSREVAIAWLVENSSLSVPSARQVVGTSGTLTEVGKRVRSAESRDQSDIDARHAKNREEAAAALDSAGKAAKILDDGKIDEGELDDLNSLIEGGPQAAADGGKGAPLWRYEASDDEMLAGLTVKDRSRSAVDIRDAEGKLIRSGIDQGERDSRRGRPYLETAQGSRTGARYFEADTLEPLKWSPEQRADLQRVLNGIGFYGKDAKIRLGSWTKRDQGIYAELLASANEEGLTWQELLTRWKRNPPIDLLEEINGKDGTGGRGPLVIRQTDRRDLEQTAVQVSKEMIGRVDRNFADNVAAPYNALEAQAQTAAYNAADPEGGGGTVTEAPSPAAFAADRLARTDAPEVDSYSTLGAFNEILRDLGLAG